MVFFKKNERYYFILKNKVEKNKYEQKMVDKQYLGGNVRRKKFISETNKRIYKY